jgi:hypothetical protein
MVIARTISAFLIAFAVALAPTAGGAKAGVKSADMTQMSVLDDMHDCAGQSDPGDTAMDCCKSMATCPVTCFSFSTAASSDVVFPPYPAGLSPALATHPVYSRTGSPPFRPPRV